MPWVEEVVVGRGSCWCVESVAEWGERRGGWWKRVKFILWLDLAENG